jgi:hypothetical protein
MLAAEDYKVACKKSFFDTQCGGLFLHENYVIYLDVFRVRNSIEYVSEEEYFALIEAVIDRINFEQLFPDS